MNSTIKYALENISAATLHLENLGVGTVTDEEVSALYLVINARFENEWATTFSSPYSDSDLIVRLTPSEKSKLHAHAIVGRLIEMRIENKGTAKNNTNTVSKSLQENDYPYKKKTCRGRSPRPVIQYELMSGRKLGEFSSVTEAEKVTGIDDASIAKCCRGDHVHAGGYAWKYA